MYKTLLREGGAQNKPLSPTTVRTVHRVIMQAFRDLGINLDGVRQPRPADRENHGRKGVWTPRESKTFLKFHRDSRLYAAWGPLPWSPERASPLARHVRPDALVQPLAIDLRRRRLRARDEMVGNLVDLMLPEGQGA